MGGLEQEVTGEGAYNPTELAELLEGVARSAFEHNDRRRKSAMLRDMLYSIFLFDEICVKIADLRLGKTWEQQPASYKTRSPFASKVCLPMTVHCEWDEYGLAAVLHRYKRSVREVAAQYGTARELLQSDPDGNVEFCEWWTRDQTAKWISSVVHGSDEIVTYDSGRVDADIVVEPLRENTLGFVPFVVRTGRGAQLFENEAEQVTPLLYGGWKSNLFYRANLFLSVAATLAFGMANKKWIYKSETGEKTVDIDFSDMGTIPAKNDESIEPLDVTIPAELMQMLQELTARSQQATLSAVAAGHVPQGVSAAAAINLLVQGSKLTIVPAQNAVGEAYALMTQMLFDYIKAYGESDLKVWVRDGVKPLAAEQIPDWLDIKVTLAADLPQDKALLYNIAMQAWKGGFISKESGWDLIGIEDKVKEAERIARETAETTPEEIAQGKGSELAMQEQAQQQALAEQAGNAGVQQEQSLMGDAGTAAQMGGLPFEQNPQGNNPMLDMMNAQQNAIQMQGV
jgi:hypothetical protein